MTEFTSIYLLFLTMKILNNEINKHEELIGERIRISDTTIHNYRNSINQKLFLNTSIIIIHKGVKTCVYNF